MASGLLRPRLATGPGKCDGAFEVSPYGVNVFLEQEVDRPSGEGRTDGRGGRLQWLRQEFPWEDIEVHGKSDFEDRRHEPAGRPGISMITLWRLRSSMTCD